MIVGLIFKFRDSCIYTWVNVNLNFAEWNDLMFPKIHIFLFTEDEPIYTLPFSFHFSFNWKMLYLNLTFLLSGVDEIRLQR